jgi:hypothetical protein
MKTNHYLITFSFALFSLVTNAQNVASTANLTSGGLDAGTNGTRNTYYGFTTGKATISGNDNSFIGSSAGEHNISGSYNTALGSLAGNGLLGSNNVFLGHGSGRANRGNRNTYIGAFSGGETDHDGSGNVFIGYYAGYSYETSDKLIVANSEENELIWGDFALDQLKLNGKVGIGNGFPNFPTTAGSVNVSGYNLFVKGGILTEEVRVSTNWADYVFENDYTLKPLEEVEKFIKEQGHLPNVPSAKQVQEEGIELGEMAKIQQEKIEELTLYVLQLHKENQKQTAENQALSKRLLDLEQKINNQLDTKQQ